LIFKTGFLGTGLWGGNPDCSPHYR
jgi:hypothetical protein